ncbi:MAG: DUF4276 family protein [Acidimicrobiia bacterium]
MYVELLVEEPSAEEALRVLLPKMLGDEHMFEIHVFRGKRDLLAKLPGRLRGYARWIKHAHAKVAVLVDEDREDCLALKRKLERAAADAGLVTKSSAAPGDPFLVLTRFAVEELEAWFFGDCDAVRAAYPGVPTTLEQRAPFRDPDAILGGTWERLEKVLQQAGYHRGGLAKSLAARDIAAHMDPLRNRSRSFQHFHSGLVALVSV